MTIFEFEVDGTNDPASPCEGDRRTALPDGWPVKQTWRDGGWNEENCTVEKDCWGKSVGILIGKNDNYFSVSVAPRHVCQKHADEIEAAQRHNKFVLYRHWDKYDDLLYVGKTIDIPARFRQHRIKSDWIYDVVKITLERFSSHEEVMEAEKQAIISEHPRYNKHHNGGKC
jgi:predicted GIY-YIG superfamily endonuclease